MTSSNADGLWLWSPSGSATEAMCSSRKSRVLRRRRSGVEGGKCKRGLRVDRRGASGCREVDGLRAKKRPSHRGDTSGVGPGAHRRRSDEREEVGAGQRLRQLSWELGDAGHAASAPIVGRLLGKLGFELRANVKSEEAGSNHPDRDAQFDYIAKRKAAFVASGAPVISVDTKKKEL